MKLTIELEISEQEAGHLCQNSIERVMNNAIDCGEEGERVFKDESYRERASILWQDCEVLKSLVTKIWWAAQNAVREAK